MRKLFVLFGFLLLSSLPALAQRATPLVEPFGGYTYTWFDADGTRVKLNGFSGQVAVNPTRWVGFVADGSAIYGTPVGTHSRIYTYLLGPRISYRKHERWTPFVHALFGQSRLTVEVPDPSGLAILFSQTGFSLAVGGGLDAKLSDHVAIRVLQAEWFRTKLIPPATENNLRLSFGVVIRLGNRER